ncbi:DNA-directed RNA polymerase subunit beta [Thalassobacillus cyri]|uniref:DNA-directed RNA polymerase subunit beta n=1 Tax=Thalassobacillus cyri TaxID=571932 RepID=A0A1H4D6W4_9BACI|nr:DNA-directed RNA polymerase subunit beta [Thalassobacillus cyri]SEA68603.1 DNA-directed RNA polymerase subunit beta [Thalassobacillus cyri]
MPTNPTGQKQPTTRKQSKNTLEDPKAIKKETKDKHGSNKKVRSNKEKPPRRRIFPIWLRLIVITILCAVALIVGLMVGYGVLGDGQPLDVLKLETWEHIWNIATKTE